MSRVYVIGGATGVGTSSVALQLAKLVEVRSVIGTDSIREALRSVVSESLCPALFGSSYTYNEHPRNLRGKGGVQTKETLTSGFERQLQIITPALARIIKRSWHEGFGLIIEGVHASPHHLIQELRNGLYPESCPVFSVLDIKSKREHKKRLEGRRKDRELQRKYYEQAEYLEEIRTIRKYILDLARLHPDGSARVHIVENSEDPEIVAKRLYELFNSG